MKFSFLVAASSLASVLLVGCAGDPQKQTNAAGADNADELVCTREYPTGSNIPIKRCRSRAQIEEERAAAVETIRRR
jgi:hypothetical protein